MAGLEKTTLVTVTKPPSERFREIVLPHLADALRYARWLTGNATDAEDVVQEACVRALKGLDTYGGRGARAWVLTIVRHTCFSWLAKHRPQSLLLTDDPEAFETLAANRAAAETPEAALIAKADAQAVEQAIARLPHLSREVIVLRNVNGLSYREIAELLDVPVGTVMSRLARARNQLGTVLGRRP